MMARKGSKRMSNDDEVDTISQAGNKFLTMGVVGNRVFGLRFCRNGSVRVFTMLKSKEICKWQRRWQLTGSAESAGL